MTDKILSQDEIDALLKGVASGEIDTEDAKEQLLDGARAYDFTSQERIIRGRMPGLEMANESFARLFRTSISNRIMKFVDISIQNVEIIKFGDFIKIIPVPSSISIFKMEPLKGYSLLVLEAPLVFAFIEFFFGGASAQQIKSEGRAFTMIEQRVIQRVVNIALGDLQKSWNGIATINPEFVGSEINPQFVTIVTPAEIVINIEVLIEIEDFAGKLFFCIPYSMIEPVKEKLSSGIHGDKLETDQRWAKIMAKALHETSVNLSAEIGTLDITFEDIINFKVGNIINLGKSATDELLLRVEGLPKFKGHPGFSKGNQAIKLTGAIE
ncbi:MAG: flagellar motor switch protein FliM [Candidatus Brocadiales bacterium]|nr:flagellar motor switch protein FliM [Candidatus Brocadiales bacterium]